jgi:hypothetical protein
MIPMNNETIAQAQSTLKSFWAEMNTWETDAFQHRSWMGTDKIEPIARALQGIYERYLVPKDRKLGRLQFRDGKPQCADIGFPPEYDPRRETIVGREPKNSKTIVISTELANHLNPAQKTQQRYQLVVSESGFRIAKKERFSTLKNKWQLLHL